MITSWVPLIAASFLMIAGLLVVYAWLSPDPDAANRQRVEDLNNQMSSLNKRKNAPADTRLKIANQLAELGDRATKGRRSTAVTEERLVRANLPMRAGEWLVLRCITVFVVTMLGWSLASHWWGAALGLVLGAIAPPLILRFMANRRASKFEAVLPDVLTLLATSLSSGFGLSQALDGVARDAAEPAAKEFSRAIAETRIGTELPVALERVAERMHSDSMRWTMMAIKIQQEVGGNLASTLQSTAATLREREKLRGQVKALSAEGVMSAYILIALPVGLFFWMLRANAEYVSMLWTTFYGICMLVAAAVMMVLGIFWMRKTVKIEV